MDRHLATGRHAFRGLFPNLDASPSPPLHGAAPEDLLAWARRHRVAGLLQAGLPDAGAEIRALAFGQAQHVARATLEAERLFARLSPGVPSLALVKGPALAAQAWPQPGLRSFDDLDFICARDGYPELVAGLRELGYAPAEADSRRMEPLWHFGWGVAFRGPNGFMVEANHRFFPPHYPWPRGLDAGRVDGFAPLELDGGAVRAPTPALHLLLCCAHAVWHGWARLAWIVDIAGLLARHPGIRLQAEALAAGGAFARRTLAAGCGLAEAIFGPSLAGDLPPAPEKEIAEARALLEGTAPGPDGRALRRFHERFMAPREIRAYRLRRIFIPGDGDFRWLALPGSLRGLYWLLRPARGLGAGKR